MTPRIATLLVTAICTIVVSGCRGAAKSAAKPDSATVTQAGEEEDLVCVPRKDRDRSSAFVIVLLDSAAASAQRIIVNAIKDEGPFSARLVASSGTITCDAASEYVEIKVRGEQSFLALVVHTTTNNVAVNAKRLETGAMLNARAFPPEGGEMDLTWGGATRAYTRPEIRERPADRTPALHPRRITP